MAQYRDHFQALRPEPLIDNNQWESLLANIQSLNPDVIEGVRLQYRDALKKYPTPQEAVHAPGPNDTRARQQERLAEKRRDARAKRNAELHDATLPIKQRIGLPDTFPILSDEFIEFVLFVYDVPVEASSLGRQVQITWQQKAHLQKIAGAQAALSPPNAPASGGSAEAEKRGSSDFKLRGKSHWTPAGVYPRVFESGAGMTTRTRKVRSYGSAPFLTDFKHFTPHPDTIVPSSNSSAATAHSLGTEMTFDEAIARLKDSSRPMEDREADAVYGTLAQKVTEWNFDRVLALLEDQNQEIRIRGLIAIASVAGKRKPLQFIFDAVYGLFSTSSPIVLKAQIFRTITVLLKANPNICGQQAKANLLSCAIGVLRFPAPDSVLNQIPTDQRAAQVSALYSYVHRLIHQLGEEVIEVSKSSSLPRESIDQWSKTIFSEGSFRDIKEILSDAGSPSAALKAVMTAFKMFVIINPRCVFEEAKLESHFDLIFRYLFHEDKEVRSAALSVLEAFLDNAFNKQKVLATRARYQQLLDVPTDSPLYSTAQEIAKKFRVANPTLVPSQPSSSSTDSATAGSLGQGPGTRYVRRVTHGFPGDEGRDQFIQRLIQRLDPADSQAENFCVHPDRPEAGTASTLSPADKNRLMNLLGLQRGGELQGWSIYVVPREKLYGSFYSYDVNVGLLKQTLQASGDLLQGNYASDFYGWLLLSTAHFVSYSTHQIVMSAETARAIIQERTQGNAQSIKKAILFNNWLQALKKEPQRRQEPIPDNFQSGNHGLLFTYRTFEQGQTNQVDGWMIFDPKTRKYGTPNQKWVSSTTHDGAVELGSLEEKIKFLLTGAHDSFHLTPREQTELLADFAYLYLPTKSIRELDEEGAPKPTTAGSLGTELRDSIAEDGRIAGKMVEELDLKRTFLGLGMSHGETGVPPGLLQPHIEQYWAKRGMKNFARRAAQLYRMAHDVALRQIDEQGGEKTERAILEGVINYLRSIQLFQTNPPASLDASSIPGSSLGAVFAVAGREGVDGKLGEMAQGMLSTRLAEMGVSRQTIQTWVSVLAPKPVSSVRPAPVLSQANLDFLATLTGNPELAKRIGTDAFIQKGNGCVLVSADSGSLLSVLDSQGLLEPVIQALGNLLGTPGMDKKRSSGLVIAGSGALRMKNRLLGRNSKVRDLAKKIEFAPYSFEDAARFEGARGAAVLVPGGVNLALGENALIALEDLQGLNQLSAEEQVRIVTVLFTMLANISAELKDAPRGRIRAALLKNYVAAHLAHVGFWVDGDGRLRVSLPELSATLSELFSAYERVAASA
ncbi:MAG: hypothetical protein HY586_02275 [Candidatus Omnitrophica bacterium]|nr:hypothetical protein [Candidatus Omnitrophota bacterium]